MQPNTNFTQHQPPPPPYSYGMQPTAPPPYTEVNSGHQLSQAMPSALVHQPGPVSTPGVPTNVIINQPPPVAVQRTIVQTSAVTLGKAPASLTCLSCQRLITTEVARSLKVDAWICCILLCLCGCELCFWIPFVMDSNYITSHSCPACHAHLGTSM
ncbi:unnamed protein product [Clavelina lepadiformis]|uniref:LITAF domain-containing protein n=1 Tax=Clavelina lepadiformis TaxID=159417 RepID=A0ABP0GG12_CLALP